MHLSLVSTQEAITYTFRAVPDGFGWACCTVNDATGELLITSVWGNWSHRWSADPQHLGAPSLTAFIGSRADVDYLARKLQGGSFRAGQCWSAVGTARALRRRVRERRLEEGREQLEGRLEPEDYDCGRIPNHLLDRYTAEGLPMFSHRDVAAPTWQDPSRKERLPYLSREAARELWKAIGALADAVSRSPDLFYERAQQIEGFCDYVTEEPWEYGEMEQMPEDRALRDIVLPALIAACRERRDTAICVPSASPSQNS